MRGNYFSTLDFLVTGGLLGVTSVLFSILVWFLLLNCGLKYEVLGNQLQNMSLIRAVDTSGNKLLISEVDKVCSLKI